MEIGLVNGSPIGVMYLPCQPPPEPEDQVSFPPNLHFEFIQWCGGQESEDSLTQEEI